MLVTLNGRFTITVEHDVVMLAQYLPGLTSSNSLVYAKRDYICAWTSPESGIHSGCGVDIHTFLI